MKFYPTEAIRNVALAGHSGTGKTSLAEAILYTQNLTDRLGSTTDGTTVSDYDPEEIRRQHSISASLLPVEYNGVKINVLDLPGRRDFVGESKSGLRAAEAAVLVIEAATGVDAGFEFAWEYCDQFNIQPRIVFINKVDKDRASCQQCIDQLNEQFEARFVPAALPVGEESNFKGVVDLLRMKFVEEKDKKVKHGEIPAEFADLAKSARAALVEAAAEGDDELTMKFLDDQPLTEEEVVTGLKGAMMEGRVVPVVCGSATQVLGITPLLDLIAQCVPNPAEGPGLTTLAEGSGEGEAFKVTPEGAPLAYIFKTVSDPYAGHLSFFKVMRGEVASEQTLTNVNQGKSQRLAHVLHILGKKHEHIDKLAAGDLGAVGKLDATHTNDTLSGDSNANLQFAPTPLEQPTIQMAVHAKNKADEDKVGLGFHRLVEQDPTLNLRRDPEVGQTILSGMGMIHLEVAVNHLKDLAKVEVELDVPKVPYRETITKKVEGQGKYKKQSGGRGQYGDCWIRLEPLPEGSGFEFEWAIVGGAIPTKFQPAVEKGLLEALEHGVISGSPTVDIKATCYDGSYHDVDSSEMAFKVAASLAFKKLAVEAGPVLLEPIYNMKIRIPDENMGDIMGDLSSRRGRVLGTSTDGKRTIVEAQAPLAEIFTYRRELNSMTHGRGMFQMSFDHYERVPPDVQEKIAAEHAAQKAEGS